MCNCAEIRAKLREALLNAKIAEAVKVAAQGVKEIVKGG